MKSMDVCYQNIESKNRYYKGIEILDEETRTFLCNDIKKNILDSEQKESLSELLKSLPKETGFEMSESLMVDIQSLENDSVNVPSWRIGEAMAEVVLEKGFKCRFHWNELRDARNPKGNKTGADLVGFIESEGQVLFLFGEVKTSSETQNKPPQVMTKSDGIENQLKELYNSREKRLILIQCRLVKNSSQSLVIHAIWFFLFMFSFIFSSRSYYFPCFINYVIKCL